MSHESESQSASVPATDKQAEEVPPRQRYGAKRGVWTDKMLIALERGIKGNKWFSLMDKVVSERTLGMAWQKVKTNAGACGVDCITVRHFSKDSHNRLLAVKEQLREGRYQPKPIRRVHIAKPGSSEKRPLGIPTVTDRVVQSALKLVIEPIFEREFAASSYGFRPGRGCKDALREVERLLQQGNGHVVDVDIKGYFDNIPHQALLRLVEERIADGKVLGLIEAFLKQGVLEEGIITDPLTGSPQGGIISPMLANIYLNPLDWLLESLGLHSVRYADDIVVLAADAYFDFLGYRFKRSRKGKLLRLVRPKSKQSLRAKLRKPTKRSNGRSLEAVITLINPVLQGWFGYFKQAHRSDLSEMDGWVRMRLRSILRKRHKRKGKGRGLDHYRWPNRYFENLGLFSLEQAREKMMSLRNGVKC